MPNTARKPTGHPPEYSEEERSHLLQLAHRTVNEALAGIKTDATAPGEHLAEPRGAFVTLHLHGQLRGCVGFIAAVHPLCRTIVEAATSAAFEDTRFSPVTAAEAQELRIEISVLSPLTPIAAEQVEVGRHGLIVSQHGLRGLLLPQVPLEYGWDRTTFLQQTCVKAGLPPDAWQHGAKLEAFVAEVFGEE